MDLLTCPHLSLTRLKMVDQKSTCADCVEKCKYGRDLKSKKGQILIRCLMCVRWYHSTCVDVADDETVGAWTCPGCREIFLGIGIVQREVFNWTEKFDDIAEQVRILRSELKYKELREKHFKDKIKEKESEICAVNALLSDTKRILTLSQDENISQAAVLRSELHDRDITIARLTEQLHYTRDAPRIGEPGNLHAREATGNPSGMNFPKTYSAAVKSPAAAAAATVAKEKKPVPTSQPLKAATVTHAVQLSKIAPKSKNVSTAISGSRKNSSALRAARRKFTVRINHLSTETTCEMLRDFITTELEVTDSTELDVEEIPPPEYITSPSYKCFKVQLPHDRKDAVMNSDLWPEYTYVKPYRTPRQQTSAPSE